MKDSVLDNAFASASIPVYSKEKRDQTIDQAKQIYANTILSNQQKTKRNDSNPDSNSIGSRLGLKVRSLFNNRALNYGGMAAMSLIALSMSYSVFQTTSYKPLTSPPVESTEPEISLAVNDEDKFVSRGELQFDDAYNLSETSPSQQSVQKRQRGASIDSLAIQQQTIRHHSLMPDQDYQFSIDNEINWSQPDSRNQFSHVEQNTIRQTSIDPVSTFSIDTDTASYSFIRRQLEAGRLPQVDAVRIEEMINYFDYNYPQATDFEIPFTATTQVVPSPWNSSNKLVHIGIKAFDLPADSSRKSNLVFLIDTSGSMQSADKLPLLVNSLRLLLDTLTEEDTVAIVTYAGQAGVVLPPTHVKNKIAISSALDQLIAGGSTAGQAGIEQAYSLAEQNYHPDAVNRVVLATDGDFNVGISNPDKLQAYIEKKRDSGVFLSVMGFGEGNYNDELMQVLAQNGNGQAYYIDTLKEAQKILIEQASSTLFPVAKDVKIQIEFNPDTVAQYRLLGYETRQLATEDFNNDKIDAAEIGAGHTVTAIYEITTVDERLKQVDKPRYTKEQTQASGDQEFDNEYAFLKIRYKKPESDQSQKISMAITHDQERGKLEEADTDVRFAVAVAGFGQLLKQSQDVGELTYDDIVNLSQTSRGEDEYGYRSEFVRLVKLAKSLNQYN